MAQTPVRISTCVWINPDDFLLTPTGRLWTPERNEVAWKQAYAALTSTLAQNSIEGPSVPTGDLYLVVGLQGAGKSTWIRNNAERLAPCVFFDAALPRAIHRRPLITIAQSAGTSIHAVWVDVELHVALYHNSLRPEDERVPESSIRSVDGLFEPPTASEGYADVLRVQSDGK